MKVLVSLLIGVAVLFALLVTVIHDRDHGAAAAAAATRRIEFYDNGVIHVEYDVDSRGRVHGAVTEYWPTGEVNILSEWEHGVAVGTSQHFEKDGTPIL